MSQEETNKILSHYYSAIDCYEEVESLFGFENLDYKNVTAGLQRCCKSIENIIFSENNKCSFLVPLFLLKEHAVVLLAFIENERSVIYTAIKTKKPYELESTNVQDKEKMALLGVIKSVIETPRIKGLDEVAGLWEVKKLLKNLVILPKTQPQLFKDRKCFNSILLFGPPGTGKTHLVHALAHDAGALLFCVTVGNMLSPLVGQSEKQIKFLFDYIQSQNKFSLLFIDEVDGFCRKRSNSEQEFSRRIKTELLCQMGKIESNSNVFLISATNCPWDIDPAFLRRFRKRMYIPLPDHLERRDLFRMFTSDTPLEKSFNMWAHLIPKTEGFSGSDISDLVQQALNLPILELEDTKIWKTSSDGFYEPIQPHDFDLEDIICSELDDLPPCSVRARSAQPTDLENAFDGINVTVKRNDIAKYIEFTNR
ncbi:uncharacterized protein [Diabrotica undecimpunctata]|uniref:uncharacterized protein isoform X1 n=1 Tax=Diabrotica undecimpunctata TaxID=50387 RepID=UPI003B6414DF